MAYALVGKKLRDWRSGCSHSAWLCNRAICLNCSSEKSSVCMTSGLTVPTWGVWATLAASALPLTVADGGALFSSTLVPLSSSRAFGGSSRRWPEVLETAEPTAVTAVPGWSEGSRGWLGRLQSGLTIRVSFTPEDLFGSSSISCLSSPPTLPSTFPSSRGSSSLFFASCKRFCALFISSKPCCGSSSSFHLLVFTGRELGS